MALDMYKTVVVFNKDLSKEEFEEREIQLLKNIAYGYDPTLEAVPCYIHQVKGFGNTKVNKGSEVMHGWCDYIYYRTEKSRADEITKLLSHHTDVTAFETIILKGKAEKQIDKRRRINVDKIQKTYINKTKQMKIDYFDLIFNC
jgi:hypothetical protein